MTETLHLIIPGVPVAQPRPRGTAKGGKRVHVYQAKKTHAIHTFKATAKIVASAAMKGSPPWTEPLSISVQFVFGRVNRLNHKKYPTWRLPMSVTPDIDNLLKAVLDGLNGVLWADDRQVCKVQDLSKWYAAVGEEPKTVLMVTR